MGKHLLTIFFLQIGLLALGQVQIASPKIVNYNSDHYKAGMQNWDVAQDKRGILYFANNEGLLSFNGRFWRMYRLPNLTAARSVEIDSKNRIFVGGQDEIGYFFPDENGVLKYNSLTPLVSAKDRTFADIWNIEILNDEVFFRSTNKIIHYKDGAVRIYKPAIEWAFLGAAGNQLFAHALRKGLMVYDNGSWKPLCNHPALDSSAVTSVTKYGRDTFLISTLKNGLLLLHNGILERKRTELDKTFFNDRIYCVTQVNEDWFAVGTTSAGVLIMNRDGKLIQRYTFQEGLQQNNVRGVLMDHNRGLWLAMNDGIDFIAVNSSVKYIFPDKSKQTTGYAVNLFNHNLYIGTSNGLYSVPVEQNLKDFSLSKGRFSEVANARGQVWSLDVINSQLLMGHEDGFFVIDGAGANQVYSYPGTWLFQPVSNVYPSSDIIAGTYLGLQHIRYSNGVFTNLGHIDGAFESLRFIAFDNATSTVWAAHPYRGVFKLELSKNTGRIIRLTTYSRKDGLPSTMYNYLFRVKNRIVIATMRGVYEYNPLKNRFEPCPVLNVLKGLSLQYLREDADGNVWFVTEKKVGVVAFHHSLSKTVSSLIYFPELNGKVVGGFESIYPFNDENVFIGGNKGVFHLNYKKYRQSIKQPDALLGLVKVIGKKDSIIFGGYFTYKDQLSEKQDKSSIKSLPYGMNSLHFEFSSTLFDQQGNIEYRYQLKGFDKEWSGWSDKAEKDYTNLHAGDYTFIVSARNNLRNESEPVAFSFTILPPWYQSPWIYFLYFVCAGGALLLVLRQQQKKYQKKQAQVNYLHQLELDRTEKEIVRLKNEQLEADVNFKNRELSGMTMHLLQRGEVLTKVKEVISTLVKKHDIDKESSPAIRQLLRLIREVERSEDDWEKFTIHFNHVNADFFAVLKDRAPDLTPNELKLCAYIKMNLSSKEIAQLLNITIKAIEVARYRLRKKLHVASDVNLYDFFIRITKDENKL